MRRREESSSFRFGVIERSRRGSLNSPFHVPVSGTRHTTGFVLCDQMRIIDPTARNACLRDHAPQRLLFEVTDVLIGMVEVLGQPLD